MTPKIKLKIKAELIAGGTYALIMAGFDYIDGESFRIWRFLFNFLFFGLLMSWIAKPDLTNEIKNNKP